MSEMPKTDAELLQFSPRVDPAQFPKALSNRIAQGCGKQSYICRATTRPPRPSSTAECLRLIAHLRGEQASAASWEPRPPFEATEMD